MSPISRLLGLVALGGAAAWPGLAAAEGWPEVFDPLAPPRALHLELEPADWDTIRYDLGNSIEVPAWLAADDETPILVTVRRKSSRALPSEADPVKIGLKIDINDLVKGQEWHGLVKLSLENGGDVHPVHEGLAWNLHELASVDGFYGADYHPALANWVRLDVNGAHVGLYTSVEQRDKRFLENRGLYLKDRTWFYEIDDVNGYAFEVGDLPHSPAFAALCYRPFSAASGKSKAGSCPTPDDATLATELSELISMPAMLTQGAIDAFTDNPDALFSKGKNFFYADFATDRGLRRHYYPWDLDAVFRSTSAGIYGQVDRRGKVAQTDYERVILGHPDFRAEYNDILLGLLDETDGPLSETRLHAFLDDLEAVLSDAIQDDPYIAEDPAQTFAALRDWISARIAHVRAQVAANGPPAPR
ncbi:MAG TPA: CotH kinase family protein [Geminicoccaceae bacterium]|nr:CotH kinase family protein [Geminicoccaceae bacterium]